MRFAIVFAVAAFGVGLTTAHADSFSNVSVSGTFSGGTTFSGTITIDSTTGAITAASLTSLGPLAGSFTLANLTSQGGDGPNGYVATFTNGSVTLQLVLFTADGTLFNYNGGGFCFGNPAAGCGDPTQIYGPGGTETLSEDSFQTPEPATYLLLGGGLLGLGLLSRKRLMATA